MAMEGILVGYDMDVSTPLPQYLVSVQGPFTPCVSHIKKHHQAYIHLQKQCEIHRVKFISLYFMNLLDQ